MTARIMMDEGDERPEETAQFELIPGVTPGVPERSAYVREEVDTLVPSDGREVKQETPK